MWDFDRIRDNKFTVQDVAHNLSNICRFNGGCDTFYSVAQHSVGVSLLVEKRFAKQALLHDKAEFAYGDMTTWLKEKNPQYVIDIDEADDFMSDCFGVPRGMPPEIKAADWQMLALEKRELFKHSTSLDGFHHVANINPDEFAHLVDVKPWTPYDAKHRFLARYYQILADEPY